MFLSDHQIIKRAKEGMISPFQPQLLSSEVHDKSRTISYGTSSYGYDARLDNSFLIPDFTDYANPIVDPKNSNIKDYKHIVRDNILIPPHSFVLGQTIETFRIPRDILALCIGKSTYARCGIIVNVTPLEPEWEGTVTIEISNTNVKPAKIYAGEGIAQFLFAWCAPFDDLLGSLPEANEFKIAEFIHENMWNKRNLCQTSYADRKGKYQGQTEVTLPK